MTEPTAADREHVDPPAQPEKPHPRRLRTPTRGADPMTEPTAADDYNRARHLLRSLQWVGPGNPPRTRTELIEDVAAAIAAAREEGRQEVDAIARRRAAAELRAAADDLSTAPKYDGAAHNLRARADALEAE